ncbi:carbohydrate ABC transporter permease [Paenibacillus sp. 2TAB23]|uniref:carbohydrate ABC transporter permease n=1 Tax=Paenibacillus sp. 2TAB23 TaxID=3233004 RepID=UPI003F9B33F7
MKGMTVNNKGFRLLFIYLFMSVLAVLFLFPTVWMLAASTKPDVLIYSETGKISSFIPNMTDGSVFLRNYAILLTDYKIWRFMLNSSFYSAFIVIGNIIVSSMAGYALAKFHFPGKSFLLGLIVFLIVVPIETTIIPLYTIVHRLGLTGTIFAVLIPPLVSVFNIFLFRQSFVSVPRELEEAAIMDGASKLQVYYHIILATSKPIIATIATLNFIGVWNDYIWPIMVLPAPSGNGDWPLYPIQAALNSLAQQPMIETGQIMAALTLATIPLIVVYALAQKYIVEGFSTAGIK